MTLNQNSSAVFATAYTYDNMGRIATVGDGTNTATYTRQAGTGLLTNTAITNGASTVLSRTRTYDNLNRLTSVTNSIPSVPSVVKSYSYTLNAKDQRTRLTMADGSYWDYSYDDKGQVTGGVKKDASANSIPGLTYAYNFDDIGNRTVARLGDNLLESTYTSNNLNQYTQMTVPSLIFVAGRAVTDAKVTVVRGDGSIAGVTRTGNYFTTTLPVDNSSSAVTENLVVNAVKYDAAQEKDIVAAENRTGLVLKTPRLFTCDDDGNMTSDSVWSYTWNGENRLVEAVKANEKKLEFSYDYKGRMFDCKAYSWSGSAWQLDSTEKYVWDGWNKIAVCDASDNLKKSMLWGEDINGGFQTAGGVGGLLAVTDTNSYYPMYDGNGNVMDYVDISGNIVAEYEYSPAADMLKMTGTKAEELAAIASFSTKPYRKDMDASLYQKRILKNGRWLSRDPLGEFVGKEKKFNLLYGFVDNNPVSNYDMYGLYNVETYDDPWSYRPWWWWNIFDKPTYVVVTVEQCEIVILHGHGNANKPHIFNFKHKDSAGAFVGCGAGKTNGLIEELDTGNLLQGASMSTEDLLHGVATQMIDSLLEKAERQARTFKSCCWVKIVVTSHNVGNYKYKTGGFLVRGGKLR